MKQVHVLSQVGIGSTDLGMLDLKRVGRRRRRDQPHTVEFDGVSYLTGSGVEQYARPTERMDFHRLSDGAELRALTYTALGILLGSGRHTISVIEGVPVEVMADEGLARKTQRSLRSWMKGDHAFSVDGDEVEVQIDDVRILAQPAGAFMAWGFNDEGRWVRERDDMRALVGVCDIGFNTLDLYALQEGAITGRYTDGDTAGMRRAAETLVDVVRQQYGVRLTLHQADTYLRERHPVLRTAGEAHPLDALVEQAKQSTVGAVVEFLERKWDNGRQFAYVLFTGGGSEALRDALLQQYPFGVVMPDAVTANALGLARYGRRIYRRKAKTVVGLDPGFGGFKAVALD